MNQVFLFLLSRLSGGAGALFTVDGKSEGVEDFNVRDRDRYQSATEESLPSSAESAPAVSLRHWPHSPVCKVAGTKRGAGAIRAL